MILHPGDIVLVHGKGWLGRWIRRLEPGPSWVSHVALAVDSANIVEALGSGVVERRLDGAYPPSRVRVYRPKNVPEPELVAIAKRAEARIGQPYGWTKLVAHAIDACLGGVRLARRFVFVDRWPICSWAVGEAYASQGYTFGVDYHAVTPDGIADYCAAHPEKYERVA